MDVAGVLHEARDADSRACNKSQVRVEYNIMPYTSTSITLSHFCQIYYSHCNVTSSDRGMGRLGCGLFMLVFGWGNRGWVSFFIFFVLFMCC